MKVVMPILCLLVVLGVLYGLAFNGILPAQQWADKNPKMAPLLRAAHLAKAEKPKGKLLDKAVRKPSAPAPRPAAVPAPLPPAPVPMAATMPPAVADTAPAPDTHAKLDAIYASMSPDDLARIFAKLPDPAVIQSLLPMDEKKAGKVLAALPEDRAARLSQRMMAAPTRTALATPTPSSSLP